MLSDGIRYDTPLMGVSLGVTEKPQKGDTPTMPLSDAAIRNLKPREKEYKVSDFDGLFLRVKPNGSRLWQFKYRIDSKEKLLSIGIYPEVTLAQARVKTAEARALLAAGNDPGEAKKNQKQQDRVRRGNTFETVARNFIAKEAAEGRASATQKKTEWLLGMAMVSFGDRPISEVTPPIVLACLRKVEAKGNYETAKRLRSRIGAVFRFAIANGVADSDPTAALRGALIRPTVTPRAAICASACKIDPLGGVIGVQF